jgi:DNA helicase-2/ATP-dependent DNA helicase PcrA
MSPFLSELRTAEYEVAKAAPEDGFTGFGVGSPGIAAGAPLPKKKRKKKAVLEDFTRGCRVDHPFFGTGTVHKTTPPRSLDVAFDRHGMKTLHLDYAKLTILDG